MSKFALVTGTDHGLGFELVKKLLEKGYQVFAGCYSEPFDQFQQMVNEYGDQLKVLRMDIANTDSVRRAREFIGRYTEHLDLLINNAGILGEIDITIEDEINYEDVENVIHVNAIGTLKVTNIMFDLIKKGEDKVIVTISSEAGSIQDCGRDSWFGYCMSKSALNMECALIQNHFKKYNGQVLAVHPGWMRTYMRGKLDEDATQTPEYSAECILTLVEQIDQYRGDKAVYLDYSGNRLNW